MIFRFFTCLKYFLDKKSASVQKITNLYGAAFLLSFSLKWWSWKYYENSPVEQVYTGLLFWSDPNHHHGQKSSGRYHLLWHWRMPHWKWETVLSVSMIIFLEPWNRKQWLSLNAFMYLLKSSLAYWLFISCPPLLAILM